MVDDRDLRIFPNYGNNSMNLFLKKILPSSVYVTMATGEYKPTCNHDGYPG